MSTDLSGQVRRNDYEALETGTPVPGDQVLFLEWSSRTLKRTDTSNFGGGGECPAWCFDGGDASTVYTSGSICLDEGSA